MSAANNDEQSSQVGWLIFLCILFYFYESKSASWPDMQSFSFKAAILNFFQH
jgi:hypothetical protein